MTAAPERPARRSVWERYPSVAAMIDDLLCRHCGQSREARLYRCAGPIAVVPRQAPRRSPGRRS